MRGKILSLVLSVTMILAATCIANAEVSADYDLLCLANDGDETTLEITAPYDTNLWSHEKGGLTCTWEEQIGSVYKLRIKATRDTDIGNNTVLVRDENDNSNAGFDIINVLVYDNYKTDIYSAKAGKKKATIKWDKGYSDYYELQYKQSGGVWKTAFFGKGTSCTVKSLKSKKKYSFRVRPVTYSYEWDDQYGPWSDSVSVKVK